METTTENTVLTESPSSTPLLGELADTPESTQVKAPETTEAPFYYFQTVENFVQLDSDLRSPSELFRNDKSIGDLPKPQVDLVASIPSSVTIQGRTYEIDLNSLEMIGRQARCRVKNVESASNIGPFISFDAINGQMIGAVDFYFYEMSEEERGMTPLEQAKSAVQSMFPFVNFDHYTVYSNSFANNAYDPSGLNSIMFRGCIGGIHTSQYINVSFNNQRIDGIYLQKPFDFEYLTQEHLDSIHENEHQKVMDSLIEYVRNGNEIYEPILNEKYLVWVKDDEYALIYEIDIQEKMYGFYNRIKVCFFLR